ncbi:hypothetical protein DFH08DRAFT_799948 [Mycena albidolilacea]|uniref:Uncharacterized protein n=1 Tax=Mycena albidolilacea TaxID=1033008 RepID=A0AAD7AMM0_9AGAR|nr:hypothetical protein DFH08DRAFT_799948 [Mycena albidolilacea]
MYTFRPDTAQFEAQISEVLRKFRVEVRAVSWDTRVCQVWTKARLVSEIDAARISRIAGCRKSGGRLRSSCWNSIRGRAKHAIRKKETFYADSTVEFFPTDPMFSVAFGLPENIAESKELCCDFDPVESKTFNCSCNLTESVAEIDKVSYPLRLTEPTTFSTPQVQRKTIDSAVVPVFPKAEPNAQLNIACSSAAARIQLSRRSSMKDLKGTIACSSDGSGCQEKCEQRRPDERRKQNRMFGPLGCSPQLFSPDFSGAVGESLDQETRRMALAKPRPQKNTSINKLLKPDCPVRTKTWGLVDVWVDVWAKVCHQIRLETISSPQIQVQLCIPIPHRKVERPGLGPVGYKPPPPAYHIGNAVLGKVSTKQTLPRWYFPCSESGDEQILEGMFDDLLELSGLPARRPIISGAGFPKWEIDHEELVAILSGIIGVVLFSKRGFINEKLVKAYMAALPPDRHLWSPCISFLTKLAQLNGNIYRAILDARFIEMILWVSGSDAEKELRPDT